MMQHFVMIDATHTETTTVCCNPDLKRACFGQIESNKPAPNDLFTEVQLVLYSIVR